jgi:hypothetical protein
LNPIASIYSNKLIKNRYQTISVNSVSGITGTNLPLATLKNDGTWTPGIIYAPYVAMTEKEYRKWKLERLKIE